MRCWRQAYTEQRTIELRMPGAKYGPMRVQRGGDLDLPAEFYRAEDIIKTESAKHPEDPKWLHAQAKAYILEWKYDNAIRELDHALERKPDDPRLLSDKAIALFERAQKNSPNSTMDYGEAAQQFSKVLEIRPDDSVALFNRAIVYRESGRYDEAISDFEHYLALDQAGPWADEAKDELQQLKKKIKPHQDSLNEPLAPPDIFAGLARDPSGIAKLNERIEDYQDIAIRTWLPEAYSPNAVPAVRNDAIAALHALGKNSGVPTPRPVVESSTLVRRRFARISRGPECLCMMRILNPQQVIGRTLARMPYVLLIGLQPQKIVPANCAPKQN